MNEMNTILNEIHRVMEKPDPTKIEDECTDKFEADKLTKADAREVHRKHLEAIHQIGCLLIDDLGLDDD